jgi:hypothetical protein
VKFKSFLIAITIVGVSAFVLMATDTSKRPGYYDDRGYTVGQMMLEFIDSTTYDDSIAHAGLTGLFATPTGNAVAKQLERRVKTVPISTVSATADTLWTQLFTVPAGQTITVTEMLLSAHLEGEEANDSLYMSILYYTGAATSALDTAVAQFSVDNDSAVVYADTIYTLTMIDSVFTAGDIVTCWWMGLNGGINGSHGLK